MNKEPINPTLKSVNSNATKISLSDGGIPNQVFDVNIYLKNTTVAQTLTIVRQNGDKDTWTQIGISCVISLRAVNFREIDLSDANSYTVYYTLVSKTVPNVDEYQREHTRIDLTIG